MLLYDCSNKMAEIVDNFFHVITSSLYHDVCYDQKTEKWKNYARNYCIMSTGECSLKEVRAYYNKISGEIYNDFIKENNYTEKDLDSCEVGVALSEHEQAYYDSTGEDFTVIELEIYESFKDGWICADITVKLGYGSIPFLTMTVKSIDGTCEGIEKELYDVAESFVKGV